MKLEQWQSAWQQLIGAGSPFEVLTPADGGVKYFRHSAASVWAAIDSGRVHGDREFLVWEQQRLTFSQFFDQVDRLVDFALFDQGGQVLVFVVFAHGAARGFVERDDQRAARHQLAHEAQQHVVAGQARQQQVEFAAQPYPRGAVAAAARGVFGCQRGADLFQ